jgi:hypothetical protein
MIEVKGSRGGNARKEKLSKEERSAIAKAGAQARWAKKKTQQIETEISFVNSKTGETSAPSPAIELASPVETVPVAPVEPVKPPKPARRKPMIKEFGKAHSYAEKRLAEAIKERAEAMGKVAMLNAEIPSLVQIIKALGATPNLTGMQDYSAQVQMIPNPAYQQPQYQPNPIPMQFPADPQLGTMPIAPRGGAIDLDFTPEPEPPLPTQGIMGGAWR